MSIKNNFPSTRPSLIADFRNSETVDPRIVSARASTATFTDKFGVIQTAVANDPRITFDAVTVSVKGDAGSAEDEFSIKQRCIGTQTLRTA